jgi:hypothetical protein
MSLFVLSNSPAKRISLKAGSWIGYEDRVRQLSLIYPYFTSPLPPTPSHSLPRLPQIFKTAKVTQIVEIPKQRRASTVATSPLVLANGDILFLHDLICKYTDDPSLSSPPSSHEHSGYHPLDEYRMVAGRMANIKVPHSLSSLSAHRPSRHRPFTTRWQRRPRSS